MFDIIKNVFVNYAVFLFINFCKIFKINILCWKQLFFIQVQGMNKIYAAVNRRHASRRHLLPSNPHGSPLHGMEYLHGGVTSLTLHSTPVLIHSHTNISPSSLSSGLVLISYQLNYSRYDQGHPRHGVALQSSHQAMRDQKVSPIRSQAYLKYDLVITTHS